MTLSRILTVDQLREKGACSEQRRDFYAKYGASLIVTENVFDDVADKFDWRWGAYFLLSDDGKKEWGRIDTEAENECRRKTAEARRIYDELCVVYWKKETSTNEEDEDIKRKAKDYSAAVKLAGKERRLMQARTFARLYVAEAEVPTADFASIEQRVVASIEDAEMRTDGEAIDG